MSNFLEVKYMRSFPCAQRLPVRENEGRCKKRSGHIKALFFDTFPMMWALPSQYYRIPKHNLYFKILKLVSCKLILIVYRKYNLSLLTRIIGNSIPFSCSNIVLIRKKVLFSIKLVLLTFRLCVWPWLIKIFQQDLLCLWQNIGRMNE